MLNNIIKKKRREENEKKMCIRDSSTITQKEYDEVVDYAIDLGVENGFVQEGETAKESFIPQFDDTGL